MLDPYRDVWGRLAVDPDKLPRCARIDVLRRLAGQLQAGETVEFRWLGRKLGEWLSEGGDLVDVLRVRPSQGSTATTGALVRASERRELLVKLVDAVGSCAGAARVLQGLEAPPAGAEPIVHSLRALGAPTSRRSIVRARSATRHGG